MTCTSDPTGCKPRRGMSRVKNPSQGMDSSARNAVHTTRQFSLYVQSVGAENGSRRLVALLNTATRQHAKRSCSRARRNTASREFETTSMSTLRRYSSAMDSAVNCEGCFRRHPAIVIEDYPMYGDAKTSLCVNCAARALDEHPDLLETAVVQWILSSPRHI